MWVWNNFTFDSLLYILQNLVLVDWFAMAIKLLGICFSVWNCEGVPVDNSRILDQCYVHFIFLKNNVSRLGATGYFLLC